MSRLKTRLLRLKSIERELIQSGEAGINVQEVASKTETDRRTIYRDLVFLEIEMGLPIYKSERGRYCMLLENYASPFPGATL